MAAAMDAEPSSVIDIEARARLARVLLALRLRLLSSSALRLAAARLQPALFARALTSCVSEPCRVAQAYASLYSGRTRGSRLVFAAERGGAGLELEALRLAAEHAKQGEDTQFYAQARATPHGRHATAVSPDNPTCRAGA